MGQIQSGQIDKGRQKCLENLQWKLNAVVEPNFGDIRDNISINGEFFEGIHEIVACWPTEINSG